MAIGLDKTNRISPARLAAYEILFRVDEGAYSSILLAQKETELDLRDRALCHELVMGVLRRQLWLDRLAERFMKRPIEALDAEVRLILRLGLYQLRFLSRVPPSAVVNESVNLTHHARLRSAGALINAVLRRAVREADMDPAAGIADPVERLSLTSSHPAWLVHRWIGAFGISETEAFCHANNQAAPVAFRVVRQRAEASTVIANLGESGAVITPSEVTPDAWRLSGNRQILSDMIRSGEVYVQDEASQMVVDILQASPGERVLDLCAAPGSKTTQIADRLAGTGNVIASDVHSHRLRLVVDSARVQNLVNVQCVLLDGVHSLPFKNEAFDRVLVDAPCSGTGTLRRNPEIRWRISATDIEDLSARQQQLLGNASRVVRPGGRLVYSTCSVELEENESVARAFLENNINFSLIELSGSRSTKMPGTVRTWPQHEGSDGFFVAAFERRQ